jgi:hypothetical protein
MRDNVYKCTLDGIKLEKIISDAQKELLEMISNRLK